MKPLSKHYSENRRCKCNKRITNANVSGLCKPCLMRAVNASLEIRQRQTESVKRTLRENPLAYARKCAILAKNRLARDPEKMRESGKRLASLSRTPEIEAKRIAALVEACKRGRLPWLPEEHRPLYRKMVKSLGIRAPEAKQIILEQIAKEKARELAKLSPFERQMRALERDPNALVANDRGPMFGEVLKVG